MEEGDLTQEQIERVDLAISISRLIHDKCDNVPHNIGMTVMNIVKKSKRWMLE